MIVFVVGWLWSMLIILASRGAERLARSARSTILDSANIEEGERLTPLTLDFHVRVKSVCSLESFALERLWGSVIGCSLKTGTLNSLSLPPRERRKVPPAHPYLRHDYVL